MSGWRRWLVVQIRMGPPHGRWLDTPGKVLTTYSAVTRLESPARSDSKGT